MRDHRAEPTAEDRAALLGRAAQNITEPMRRQGPKIQLSDDRKRKRKAAQASRKKNR